MTAVTQLLTDARLRWEPSLRDAVAGVEGAMQVPVAYHFGWVEPDGTPASAASAGKALRPGLVLAVADALGAPSRAAVPGAVAVELIHNFSLVHDDVIDRDATRRHRPTVWAQWDDTTAILAGDAMHTLAFEALADHAAATRALTAATKALIRGQAEDVAFETRDGVTLDDAFTMALWKTGELIAASASIGAVLAGAQPPTVAAFHAYGQEVGVAFQLVDDLLGIWGAPEVTGKPVHADLAVGKKSLPVVWALWHGEEALAAKVRGWYAGRDPRTSATEAELAEVAGWLADAGARDWLIESAESHVRRAMERIEGVAMSDASREALRGIADFVAARDS